MFWVSSSSTTAVIVMKDDMEMLPTCSISVGQRYDREGRAGPKPLNGYLVGSQIFTAGGYFNSSWVPTWQDGSLLKRQPRSQDVVEILQSTIGALIVLVGQTELCTDKRVKLWYKTTSWMQYRVSFRGKYPLCLDWNLTHLSVHHGGAATRERRSRSMCCFAH